MIVKIKMKIIISIKVKPLFLFLNIFKKNINYPQLKILTPLITLLTCLYAYMFICLYVCMFICLYVYMIVCLYDYLILSIKLYIGWSIATAKNPTQLPITTISNGSMIEDIFFVT